VLRGLSFHQVSQVRLVIDVLSEEIHHA